MPARISYAVFGRSPSILRHTAKGVLELFVEAPLLLPKYCGTTSSVRVCAWDSAADVKSMISKAGSTKYLKTGLLPGKIVNFCFMMTCLVDF